MKKTIYILTAFLLGCISMIILFREDKKLVMRSPLWCGYYEQ